MFDTLLKQQQNATKVILKNFCGFFFVKDLGNGSKCFKKIF